MSVRMPWVAGRFYSGGQDRLQREVDRYLQAGEEKPQGSRNNPWAVMLPHAGHIYCGNIVGKTLYGQKLPSRLIILCPNHTGRGRILAVWPDGLWLTPLGQVPVDEALASDILASDGGFSADFDSHLQEHSIEVLLPFLQNKVENLRIVPICVGTQNQRALQRAGQALAKVLKQERNADVGIVVSSDMNHFEDEKTTIIKDEHALAPALKGDADGLLQVVAKERITMCGAGPLAIALYAARDMAGVDVELVAHATSGKVSGDYSHTVGYAGLRLYAREPGAEKQV